MEKKGKKKWIVIAIIIVLVFVGIGSCGGNDNTDNKNKSEDTKKDSSKEDASSKEDNTSLKVGDTFENSGLKVTLNSYNPEFTDYSEYTPPKDGNKFIEVNFTYENTSDSGTSYVSIYDCDCYADDTLCEQAYIGNDDFVNANLSSGRNVTFSTYYEVPANAQSIELEYNDNSFWSDKNVTFTLQ